MANNSFLNVLTPQGAWSSGKIYKPVTVYGGVAATALYVSCPTVTSTGNVYYATGFKTDGTPLLPTEGVAPASDPAWQQLSGSGSESFTNLALTSNTNPLVLGTTNTVTFALTTQTGAHTFTLPNANSNPIVPLSPVAQTYVSSIGADGVQVVQTLTNQAASSPTVSNDNTQGYGAGSQWFDTVNSFLYICISAGTGAAVWTKVLVS